MHRTFLHFILILLIAAVTLASSGSVEADEVQDASAAAVPEVLTDIVIILDSTRSMNQYCGKSRRYDLARWVASDVLDVVPEGTGVAILELGDAVNELRKLSPLTSGEKSRIRRNLWTRAPAGNGELREALHRTSTILKSRKDRISLVVLVTDGEDCNSGEAHGAAAELQKESNATFVVVSPCQQGAMAQQLQALAEAGDGTFTIVESKDALDQGLSDVVRLCDKARKAPLKKLSAASQVLEQRAAALYATHQALMIKATELSASNELLSQSNADLVHRNANLMKQSDELSIKADVLTTRVDELEKDRVALTTKSSALELELETKTSELMTSVGAHDATKQQLADAATVLDQKDAQITSLTTVTEEATKSRDSQMQTIKRETADLVVSQLEGELTEIKKETHLSDSKLNELKEEVDGENFIYRIGAAIGIPGWLIGIGAWWISRGKLADGFGQTQNAVGQSQQDLRAELDALKKLTEESTKSQRERLEQTFSHKSQELQSEVKRIGRSFEEKNGTFTGTLAALQSELTRGRESATASSRGVQDALRAQLDQTQQCLADISQTGTKCNSKTLERIGAVTAKLETLEQKLASESAAGQQAVEATQAQVLKEVDRLSSEIREQSRRVISREDFDLRLANLASEVKSDRDVSAELRRQLTELQSVRTALEARLSQSEQDASVARAGQLGATREVAAERAARAPASPTVVVTPPFGDPSGHSVVVSGSVPANQFVGHPLLDLLPLLNPGAARRLQKHLGAMIDAGIDDTARLSDLSDSEIEELSDAISGVGRRSLRQWRDAARRFQHED